MSKRVGFLGGCLFIGLMLLAPANAPGGSAAAEYGSFVFSPPKDRYGAIAYSPSARRYGSSWNQPNAEQAEQEAMRMCNRADCKLLLALENSCGSLAVARNGGYVWAEGSTLYEAKLRASNRCTAEHRSCKLRCSVCSGGDVP